MTAGVTPVSRFLTVGGLRLHVAAWDGPTDRPALVMLHGIWESWRTFAQAASRFAALRRVYCVDLRGHGGSARPAAGYRFTDYASDVEALLPLLSGRPVDLLGHSLGANVALHVAAAGAPVRRLIAVDPPLLLAADWPRVRVDMRRAWRLSRRPLPEIAAEIASRAPAGDVAWCMMLASAFAGTADGVFAAMAGGEQGEVDWPALLAAVRMPTLAVAADPAAPGGQLVGDRLRMLRAALPAATVAVLPGAGHHIEADRPDEFHRTVEEFLDGVALDNRSGGAAVADNQKVTVSG
jgi:pimeloyl-ACP methyl ester carboxylesterase